MPVLSSPIDVTGLSIASGEFRYIKPDNTEGQFVGTLNAGSSTMTYQLENTDIDMAGVWKFWAVFTDTNSRKSRGDTTEITFENELM